MAKGTKAAQYSPVSLEAATIIAKAWPGNPRMLATYLALARQTSMNDEGGYGANMVTGAGAQRISQVVGCHWNNAKQYETALANHGLIKKAPAGLKAGKAPATWIMAHQGDTNLPHAVVDGLDQPKASYWKIGDVDEKTRVKAPSAIRRLLDSKKSDEVILCALMLLLHFYHNHDMKKWGGVNHNLMWRGWKNEVITPEGQSFRWAAKPVNEYSNTPFGEKILTSIGVKKSDDAMQKIFWRAHGLLKETGLIYETVMIFEKDKPVIPARINDYHAGTKLDVMQWIASNEMITTGFYTNKDNQYEHPEGCWFLWPWHPEQDGFSLKGVWSLRFRCATKETAEAISDYYEVFSFIFKKLQEQGTLEDLTPKTQG